MRTSYRSLLSYRSRERLEELIAALQAVIDRHDVLRTAVLWEQLPQRRAGGVSPRTLPVSEIQLSKDMDVREQMEERLQLRQQRLDMRRAPLVRLQIAADPHGRLVRGAATPSHHA